MAIIMTGACRVSSSPSKKSHAMEIPAAYAPMASPATLRAATDVLAIVQGIFAQNSMLGERTSRTMNVYRTADCGPCVEINTSEANSVSAISRNAG